MAYTTSVPQANQRINTTQQPIQDNFIAIKTLVDVNHGTFGSANEGKHIKISIPASSPAPTFTGSEIGLYGFVNPTSSRNELYIRNAINAQYALTAGFSDGTQGWGITPNGQLVKWGRVTANAAVFTYVIPSGTPSTGPAFTLMHMGQFTPISTSNLAATNVDIQLISLNIGANGIRVAPLQRTSMTSVASVEFFYYIIGAF